MFDAEDEVLAPDEVAEFKQAALAQEEKDDIARLLEKIRQLPPDTKAERLRDELENPGPHRLLSVLFGFTDIAAASTSPLSQMKYSVGWPEWPWWPLVSRRKQFGVLCHSIANNDESGTAYSRRFSAPPR